MTIEINHIGYVDYIQTNKKEIPNNQIDDNANAYVDDINRQNFLGNDKGKNILTMNRI